MRNISIRIGILMLVGLISFFLIMYVLGFGHRSELRAFNSIIHSVCLYIAIYQYRKLNPESVGNYLSGVAQGFMASVIGILGFTLFMTIFLSLNTELMDKIRYTSPISDYLNPFTASLFIITEGVAVTLIVSYILTRIIDMKLEKV